MPRPPRASAGGEVYHVLNRANARLQIFENAEGYADFQNLLKLATERYGTRLLAYCILPNHWHLVLWPRQDGELSECLRWLTVTHTNQWHSAHGSAGTGHLYQGRFKSFLIEGDQHFWTVCRYVERNALRAGLASTAEAWPWGSASCFSKGDPYGILATWPVERPENWLEMLNEVQTEAELESLRKCIQRGRPFGSTEWVSGAVKRFGLEASVRERGRPKISETNKGS